MQANTAFNEIMLPADTAYVAQIEKLRTAAFRSGNLQRAKYYAMMLYNLKGAEHDKQKYGF